MRNIPIDQGGVGRHKCASCAYDKGYIDGLERKEVINLSILFDSLEESQAGIHRHKSTHVAYALGYQNGVIDSYSK